MSPRSPSIPPESVSLCPGCGQAVDVLRAGHVAILEGRFRYFCDAACKERFLSGAAGLEAATATPPPVSVTEIRTQGPRGGGRAPCAVASSRVTLVVSMVSVPPLGMASRALTARFMST